jgi:hypothetical protein
MTPEFYTHTKFRIGNPIKFPRQSKDLAPLEESNWSFLSSPLQVFECYFSESKQFIL